MSRWATAALGAESWAPSRYLTVPVASAAAADWQGSLLRLGEVVDFLPARSSLQGGEAVVTPAGVSPQSGAVQPGSKSPGGTVFRLERDLRVGDVLVPLMGKGPCVLVTDEHRGVIFSRGFAALRPQEGIQGSTLWALLSSTSGIRARHQLDSGSVVPRLSVNALADLRLPELAAVPSTDQLLPSPAVDEIAATAVVSRWRKVGLSGATSWEPRRLLDPVEGAEGVAITDLAEIRTGRLDARQYLDRPFRTGVAAMRPSDVGRIATPRWWTVAEERDLAGPQSILVGALSLRVASPRDPVAVSRDILVMDVQPWKALSRAEVRDRLLVYLGSAAGQARLASYRMGSTIPRLSKKSFMTLRVPLLELLPTSAAPASATELLETRLEKALWS